MELSAAKSAVKDSAIQGLGSTPKTANPTTDDQTSKVETPEGDFEIFLNRVLKARDGGVVSEEDLFAAVMEEKVTTLSAEAGAVFAEKKAEFMESMRRPSGFVPMEDLAKAVMKDVVASGKLTQEQAEKIHGEAFLQAQLDDNMDALYDHLGGPNDATMAVASVAEAIARSKETATKIESGELVAELMSLDKPSNTKHSSGATAMLTGEKPEVSAQVIDGQGGFVWKPISESDQNLIIVMPESLKDMVERVEIHSSLPPSPETLIATHDRFTGYHAGNRGKFRFDQPGSAYGENIHVVAHLKDGGTKDWFIEDGAKRTD